MKRTCLQKAQTQNEQTACEFHPVEYFDKIDKHEPTKIRNLKICLDEKKHGIFAGLQPPQF